MVVLILYAQFCVCVSCKNSNKDINTDIENMFDNHVYDSHDEYSDDGYDSDDEENGGKLLDNEDEP